MSAIREGHKWERRPFVVSGRVYAILHAKPILNFGSTNNRSVVKPESSGA